MNAKYRAQIAQELAIGRTLTVVQSPYPQAELLRSYGEARSLLSGKRWGPNWEALEETTKAYCHANSLDAVLAIGQTASEDFLAGTNQTIVGAGFYVRRIPLMKDIAVLHLIAEMSLLDCKTGKVLARRQLSASQSGSFNAIRKASPLMAYASETATLSLNKWTESLENQIRSDMENLPKASWAVTIDSIIPRP